MEPMKPLWRATLIAAPLVFFAACSSTSRQPALPETRPAVAPPAAPASSSVTVPPASPPGTEKPPEPPPAAVTPVRRPGATKPPAPATPPPELPNGEYAVRVRSEPAGATVVLNGVPVGKTPYRLVVAGTTRGFFREPLTVKVRFIAKDAEHASSTVEEQFTAREKIPVEVCFTREGATRVAR